MKFTVDNVRQFGADSLTIHSFESGIYLVEVTRGEATGYLADTKDELLRFNSVNAIKDEFRDFPVEELWLVEETAYEEMIGLMPQEKTKLRLPLSL